MSFCLGCGNKLEDKARKQRLLSGENKEIHNELGVFLKAFVTEDETDGLVNSNSYICRQCFMKYERFLKLKKELLSEVRKSSAALADTNSGGENPMVESVSRAKRQQNEPIHMPSTTPSRSPNASVS